MANRRRDDDELEFSHAINVTPFIDVILVLLIIFMVAAPLSTANVPVELPVAAAPAGKNEDKPLYLTLQADGTLFLNDEILTLDVLPLKLALEVEHKATARLFVRADKSVDYGQVMQLLNSLRQNGYLKVGLIGLAGQ